METPTGLQSDFLKGNTLVRFLVRNFLWEKGKKADAFLKLLEIVVLRETSQIS
jgi:hypothetical protein